MATITGTPHADTLTIHPGDSGIGLAGADSITATPIAGMGSTARAFVDAGPGNDTIVDLANNATSQFPVTADGGPGNDTFVALATHTTETTSFTGGPGHDTFEFSTLPFTGASNVTITDFSKQDHVVIDVNSSDLPAVTFTGNSGGTELAAVANGAQVHVQLAGVDPSQLHVVNDGAGHDIITLGPEHGHSDFMLM
jgi:hypothetical protein